MCTGVLTYVCWFSSSLVFFCETLCIHSLYHTRHSFNCSSEFILGPTIIQWASKTDSQVSLGWKLYTHVRNTSQTYVQLRTDDAMRSSRTCSNQCCRNFFVCWWRADERALKAKEGRRESLNVLDLNLFQKILRKIWKRNTRYCNDVVLARWFLHKKCASLVKLYWTAHACDCMWKQSQWSHVHSGPTFRCLGCSVCIVLWVQGLLVFTYSTRISLSSVTLQLCCWES